MIRGHPWLGFGQIRKLLSITVSILLYVYFLYVWQIEEVFLFLHFLTVLIMNGYWTLSHVCFATVRQCVFSLFNWLILHIDFQAHSLQIQSEPCFLEMNHLVMTGTRHTHTHTPVYIAGFHLLIFCWGFCIYVHQEYLSVVL